MMNPPLDVGQHLSGIGLVPAPIEVFRRQTELDNEIRRQVFRLDFAALLAPQPPQGGLVTAR